MDYAICLLLDDKTKTAFTNIINAIADSGVERYMADAKIPPHITIALFQTEQIANIIETLDDNISIFPTSDIVWASLGAFIPQCIFAAPVMTEYLQNACINANRLVEPFSQPGDGGHYLPGQWVPHTALAVKLSPEGLIIAFDIVMRQFSFLHGKSTRIMLAECNPFRELRVWDLEDLYE
jgi:hypothetical protein